MARYEPSHQERHCLPFCLGFLTDIPICNNGFVHSQSWKKALYKFRVEHVKESRPVVREVNAYRSEITSFEDVSSHIKD